MGSCTGGGKQGRCPLLVETNENKVVCACLPKVPFAPPYVASKWLDQSHHCSTVRLWGQRILACSSIHREIQRAKNAIWDLRYLLPRTKTCLVTCEIRTVQFTLLRVCNISTAVKYREVPHPRKVTHPYFCLDLLFYFKYSKIAHS